MRKPQMRFALSRGFGVSGYVPGTYDPGQARSSPTAGLNDRTPSAFAISGCAGNLKAIAGCCGSRPGARDLQSFFDPADLEVGGTAGLETSATAKT